MSLLLRSSQEGPIFDGKTGDVLTSNGDGTADFKPASGLSFAPRIVWRDDGTGTAKTWADVMALIAVLGPGCEIYVDQVAHVLEIPASATPYDMKFAHFFAPIGTVPLVHILDGAQLFDLAGTQDVPLSSFNSVRKALDFDPSLVVVPNFFVRGDFAGLFALGVAPVIEVEDGTDFLLTTNGGCLFGDGVNPVVNLVGTSVLEIQCTNNTVQQQWFASSLVGPNTSNINILNDGSFADFGPNFPTFLGLFTNNATSTDGGWGPSAFRPSATFIQRPLGVRYWDTELGRQIQWDGAGFGTVAFEATTNGDAATAFGTAGAPATLATIANLTILERDTIELTGKVVADVSAPGVCTVQITLTGTAPVVAPATYDATVETSAAGVSTFTLAGRAMLGAGDVAPGVYDIKLIAFTDGIAAAAVRPQGANFIFGATLGVGLTTNHVGA